MKRSIQILVVCIVAIFLISNFACKKSSNFEGSDSLTIAEPSSVASRPQESTVRVLIHVTGDHCFFTNGDRPPRDYNPRVDRSAYVILHPDPGYKCTWAHVEKYGEVFEPTVVYFNSQSGGDPNDPWYGIKFGPGTQFPTDSSVTWYDVHFNFEPGTP